MRVNRTAFHWQRTAAFGLAMLAGCTTERSPVTGERQYYGMSWEQEQQLGAESDRMISRQLGLYEDEAVQRYVEEIGNRVLSESHFEQIGVPEPYRGTDFTFRVLDASMVNAFALPGGYVYVTRGLLAHMENEAQLAVVLGHEIGHVAGRHSARQALRSQWSQLGLIAGVLVGSHVLGDDRVRDIHGIGGTVLQLLLNRYSRDHEREADRLGVEYAAREGYVAAEGAGFFRTLSRIAADSGSRIPSWQSTHPDPGEREETVVELSRRLAADYPMNEVGAEAFHQVIDGLVVGDDPCQGFVTDGAFVHPTLRFRFEPPSGWALQNQTQVVLMIDPNQQALLALELAPAESPETAARELVQSQQLQVVRHGAVTINGLDAYVVEAQAQSQQGPVAVMNTFIGYQDHVYSLLGYTSIDLYATYAPYFHATAQSFGELTDPRRLDVQPYRLQVFQAPESRPFQEFLPDDLPPDLSPREIAILNQTELDAPVEAGAWLKIPRR